MPCATTSASGSARSFRARSSDMTTTAAAPSEICEALPAVIVPSFLKAGASLPSDSAVVPGRIPSSRSILVVGPRFELSSTATTSSAIARVSQARCACILLLAPNFQLAIDVVRALAHVLVQESGPQAVVNHRVDHLGVAHAGAKTRLRHEVRRLRHRLHPARHYHFH